MELTRLCAGDKPFTLWFCSLTFFTTYTSVIQSDVFTFRFIKTSTYFPRLNSFIPPPVLHLCLVPLASNSRNILGTDITLKKLNSLSPVFVSSKSLAECRLYVEIREIFTSLWYLNASSPNFTDLCNV